MQRSIAKRARGFLVTERLKGAQEAAVAVLTAALTGAADPAEVLVSYLPADERKATFFALRVSMVLTWWGKELLGRVDSDPLVLLQELARDIHR